MMLEVRRPPAHIDVGASSRGAFVDVVPALPGVTPFPASVAFACGGRDRRCGRVGVGCVKFVALLVGEE